MRPAAPAPRPSNPTRARTMNWSRPSDGTSSPSLPSLSPPGPAVAAVLRVGIARGDRPRAASQDIPHAGIPGALSLLAGWALLTAGAVAPHRAFVNLGRRVTVRIARIPKIRRLLQRKWPIWGKLLLKNKMRAEVTSYRLAINEAWGGARGNPAPEQLAAMRQAEYSITGYTHAQLHGCWGRSEGDATHPREAEEARGTRRPTRDAVPEEERVSRDGGSVDGDRSIDSRPRLPRGCRNRERDGLLRAPPLRGIVRSGSRNSMDQSSVNGGRSVANGGAGSGGRVSFELIGGGDRRTRVGAAGGAGGAGGAAVPAPEGTPRAVPDRLRARRSSGGTSRTALSWRRRRGSTASSPAESSAPS